MTKIEAIKCDHCHSKAMSRPETWITFITIPEINEEGKIVGYPVIIRPNNIPITIDRNIDFCSYKCFIKYMLGDE